MLRLCRSVFGRPSYIDLHFPVSGFSITLVGWVSVLLFKGIIFSGFLCECRRSYRCLSICHTFCPALTLFLCGLSFDSLHFWPQYAFPSQNIVTLNSCLSDFSIRFPISPPSFSLRLVLKNIFVGYANTNLELMISSVETSREVLEQ